LRNRRILTGDRRSAAGECGHYALLFGAIVRGRAPRQSRRKSVGDNQSLIGFRRNENQLVRTNVLLDYCSSVAIAVAVAVI
jgi:hypothetical protein